jgi:hypothetical protein
MIAQAGDTHKPIGKLPAKKNPTVTAVCQLTRACANSVPRHTYEQKNHPPDRPFLRDLYSRVSFFLYLIFVVQISRGNCFFLFQKN